MATIGFWARVMTTFMVLAGGNINAQTGTVDKETQGVNADWQWSKTADGTYGQYSKEERRTMPRPWQKTRENDLMWKKRVWREISILEKQNMALGYAGDEHTGGGMFIEILVDAVKRGRITAYANTDDRFTTVYTGAELDAQIKGKPDTMYFIDPTNDSEVMKVYYKDFNPSTVTKYRVIEDWMIDRNTGSMVVRIVGIAPVRDVYGDDNMYRGSQAMFWVYYPHIREVLAGYDAVNPNNDVQRDTWVEYWEGRRWEGRITKVSNGVGGVAGGYGESYTGAGLTASEALHEGKRAATMIFDKEHDMWNQ
jgi:gliding motility associated protien GldN